MVNYHTAFRLFLPWPSQVWDGICREMYKYPRERIYHGIVMIGHVHCTFLPVPLRTIFEFGTSMKPYNLHYAFRLKDIYCMATGITYPNKFPLH